MHLDDGRRYDFGMDALIAEISWSTYTNIGLGTDALVAECCWGRDVTI